MQRRLLDYDPLTGIAEYHSYDPLTDQTVIESVQDVEPVLERNKALANADDQGWSPSRDWRRAASIPAIILHKWLVEDGLNFYDRNHWPGIVRKLDDPDWRWLRTAPGHIGRRTTRGQRVPLPAFARDARQDHRTGLWSV